MATVTYFVAIPFRLSDDGAIVAGEPQECRDGGNPLGARAMYLWQDNQDTLNRIHGTVEPWTIGHSVSSGCIRMINQDAIDLYEKTEVGTCVVVLGSEPDRGVGRDGEDLWQHPERIFPGYDRGSLW